MTTLLITAAAGSVVFCLFMMKKAFENNLKKDVLFFKEFTGREMNIFFISDLHKRVLSPNLINQIDQPVDFVFIGGDITEGKVPFARVEENIRKLTEFGPAYFVWGNNDYEVETDTLIKLLEKYNVKILKNEAVVIKEEGIDLSILGVDDMTFDGDRLEETVEQVPKNSFKILLSHNPEIVKKIRKEYQISLVLSGHTHGGQIRFLNIGLYERGSLKSSSHYTKLVSNGYGTTLLPMRLGAPSEAHLITLKGYDRKKSSFK
ncbi:metallophosphoesterase [Metabacillus arenae]|uniref:Metallophosphoesterase n=1 Tax=Metabacillus arenae TaxID=2771434 RepID=A0A926NDX6_9BACI|nr:metallophosphoesterase [Metabacillus arenae]MBD1378643.1 metallophosphoesterase [Metabacillus arenae]